jgi:hypothetical protein
MLGEPKWLAKERYDSAKEMFIKLYGARIGVFLANRFARQVSRIKDLCIDNMRVGCEELGEMERYWKQQEGGCCGFSDEKYTLKTEGEPDLHYWIGFNYGH